MPRRSLDRCGGEIGGLRLRHSSTYILKEYGHSHVWVARFCDPNCRGAVHNLYCLISLSKTTIFS